MDETASESPAPGGGSISAYMGALGVALGTMVANLSAIRGDGMTGGRSFQTGLKKEKRFRMTLLQLVDEDTDAFNKLWKPMHFRKRLMKKNR